MVINDDEEIEYLKKKYLREEPKKIEEEVPIIDEEKFRKITKKSPWPIIITIILLLIGSYALIHIDIPKTTKIIEKNNATESNISNEKTTHKEKIIPKIITERKYKIYNYSKIIVENGGEISLYGFLGKELKDSIWTYFLKDDLGNKIRLTYNIYKYNGKDFTGFFPERRYTDELYNVTGIFKKEYKGYSIIVTSIKPFKRQYDEIKKTIYVKAEK